MAQGAIVTGRAGPDERTSGIGTYAGNRVKSLRDMPVIGGPTNPHGWRGPPDPA